MISEQPSLPPEPQPSCVRCHASTNEPNSCSKFKHSSLSLSHSSMLKLSLSSPLIFTPILLQLREFSHGKHAWLMVPALIWFIYRSLIVHQRVYEYLSNYAPTKHHLVWNWSVSLKCPCSLIQLYYRPMLCWWPNLFLPSGSTQCEAFICGCLTDMSVNCSSFKAVSALCEIFPSSLTTPVWPLQLVNNFTEILDNQLSFITSTPHTYIY